MHFKSVILAGTAMAAVAFAAGPTVNTPSPIIQCAAYQVTFSGGTPPYTLYATKEGDTSDILTTIASNIQGTSYSWTVNLPSGTAINLYITDSTGASNASGGATVLSSDNTSCLSGSSSGSSGGSSSSTSAASGSSSSAASSGSSPTSSASRSSQSSGTSSTSSSGSQSTGGSNGASQLTGFSAAVAGAVGVVVAALV